jgi:hypothetical protein
MRQRRRLHGALYFTDQYRCPSMMWRTAQANIGLGGRNLGLSNFLGFDETQSRVNVLREEFFDSLDEDIEEDFGFEGFVESIERAKLVYFDDSYGMLLKPAPGEYLYMFAERASISKVVDRCTGETYHAMMMDLSLLARQPAFAKLFELRELKPMSDGDSGVARGVRATFQALDLFDSSTPDTCRTHKVANIAKNSFQKANAGPGQRSHQHRPGTDQRRAVRVPPAPVPSADEASTSATKQAFDLGG